MTGQCRHEWHMDGGDWGSPLYYNICRECGINQEGSNAMDTLSERLWKNKTPISPDMHELLCRAAYALKKYRSNDIYAGGVYSDIQMLIASGTNTDRNYWP